MFDSTPALVTRVMITGGYPLDYRKRKKGCVSILPTTLISHLVGNGRLIYYNNLYPINYDYADKT